VEEAAFTILEGNGTFDGGWAMTVMVVQEKWELA
jgi:hypothetical protein